MRQEYLFALVLCCVLGIVVFVPKPTSAANLSAMQSNLLGLASSYTLEADMLYSFLCLRDGYGVTNADKMGVNLNAYLIDPATASPGIIWNGKVPNRPIGISFGNLAIAGTLNLSGFTALEKVLVADCMLTALDVSGCTSLQELTCYNSGLATLNVAGCTALEKLSCGINLLTDLDVSDCTMLSSVGVESNKLAVLDLSGNTRLTELNCYDNKLTSLDILGCTGLMDLYAFCNPFLCSINFPSVLADAKHIYLHETRLFTLPADFQKIAFGALSSYTYTEADGMNVTVDVSSRVRVKTSKGGYVEIDASNSPSICFDIFPNPDYEFDGFVSWTGIDNLTDYGDYYEAAMTGGPIEINGSFSLACGH